MCTIEQVADHIQEKHETKSVQVDMYPHMKMFVIEIEFYNNKQYRTSIPFSLLPMDENSLVMLDRHISSGK